MSRIALFFSEEKNTGILHYEYPVHISEIVQYNPLQKWRYTSPFISTKGSKMTMYFYYQYLSTFKTLHSIRKNQIRFIKNFHRISNHSLRGESYPHL